MNFLCHIFWDPNPVAFTLPLVAHPILWYSLFFALGFFLTYTIASSLLKNLAVPKKTIEALTYYLFIGMLIGARLGHVFFYEWAYYAKQPLKIFYTWEGGLASHGGAIGILIALFLFWYRYKTKIGNVHFRQLLDILCVAVPFAATCIRIGNGFNQEILGTASTLPWAFYFGHPADLSSVQPCHPVQFYEALFYFITACSLWFSYKSFKVYPGKIAGLFFISLFLFRFAIEFIKLPQSSSEPEYLYMGQLLSIPFILLGVFLLYTSRSMKKPIA